MKRAEGSFALAILLSLLLHGAAALLWIGLVERPAHQRPARVMLDAVLVSPAPEAQPPLFIPDTEPARQRGKAAEAPASGKGKAPRRSGDLGDQIIWQASEQVVLSLRYPPDAIARGLEGETLILLFLDEAGNAVAARVERGSGHAILDEAAIRAAQGVRGLTEGAAKEVLLPVRFKLK